MIKNFNFIKGIAWTHANEIENVSDTDNMDSDLMSLSEDEFKVYTLLVWLFYDFVKGINTNDVVRRSVDRIRSGT